MKNGKNQSERIERNDLPIQQARHVVESFQ